MANTGNKRDTWLAVLFALLLLLGLAVMGLCVAGFVGDQRRYELLGLGVLAVMVPAALYPIALALRRMVHAADRPKPVSADQADQIAALLRSINDRMLISDAAKRIAYREEDRQALREAIREDIEKGEFDAALALVSQMSQTYGYRQEAEEFRVQIMSARESALDHRINESVEQLDRLLEKHDWDQASLEALRIGRQFSDSPRAVGLERKVRDAREQYKLALERRFLQAAQRDDVELAMELLKELDKYLSEREAEPFRETARGVIGKKRENLGVQFKLAVQDKEWPQAIRVGQQIITDFPNSKMADEVRGMLEVLRQRANAEQHEGAKEAV